MKTVRNKTPRPLRVPLPRGRVLHLGPNKTGQIAVEAAEHPALRKLIDSGDLEIVGDGASVPGGPDDAGPAHESTQGHAQPRVVMPKGNR